VTSRKASRPRYRSVKIPVGNFHPNDTALLQVRRKVSLMEKHILSLSGLGRRFGSTRAVDNVTLDIPSGQFVGVIGRSGAGKSTLLRLINRLVEPTAGKINFGDRDVTALKGRDLRNWRRDCAMIFQQFNLVDRLDVLSNVLVGRLADHGFLSSMAMRFTDAERTIAIRALDRLDLAPLRCNARAPCRAASSSVWQLPAPWSKTPASCWQTNRLPALTPAMPPA